MGYERSLARYKRWYAGVLNLYPQSYRDRFGEGMQQTFSDLCREREAAGGTLSSLVLWVFVDTFAGIIREQFTMIMHISRTAKYIFGSLCLLFIPLFAEVLDVAGWDWSLSDYAIVAVLLTAFGAALAYATSPRTTTQRVVGIALVLLVLLTYVHLAVGIVDWLPFAGS